jgi:hypothetical protein
VNAAPRFADPAVVVAVRAALPSPRPQAWQACQVAAGLATRVPVVLIGDAPLADGVPGDVAAWLSAPSNLTVLRPEQPSRPPIAGLRFRSQLRRWRGAPALLCRDPRVAQAEAGRWSRVVHEWHVRPEPALRRWPGAGRADHHVVVAPAMADDLVRCGVRARDVSVLANACGLDPARARARSVTRPVAGPILAIGLHRRGGLDLALRAWRRHADLPDLLIAGRDQGGERVAAWVAQADSRVRLVGPAWGERREALLDACAALLALYPRDEDSERHLCPLQVADALGSGRPLVVSDLPSIRAQVGDAPVLWAPAPAVDSGPDPRALGLDSAADALAAAVRRAAAAPPLLGAQTWAQRADVLLERLCP